MSVVSTQDRRRGSLGCRREGWKYGWKFRKPILSKIFWVLHLHSSKSEWFTKQSALNLPNKSYAMRKFLPEIELTSERCWTYMQAILLCSTEIVNVICIKDMGEKNTSSTNLRWRHAKVHFCSNKFIKKILQNSKIKFGGEREDIATRAR